MGIITARNFSIKMIKFSVDTKKSMWGSKINENICD